MGRTHPGSMPDPGADQRRPSLDQRNHTRRLEDVTSTCTARKARQRGLLLLLHPHRERSPPLSKGGGREGHIQLGGGPLQQHGITCSRSAASKKDGRSAVGPGTVDGWREGGGLGLRRGGGRMLIRRRHNKLGMLTASSRRGHISEGWASPAT